MSQQRPAPNPVITFLLWGAFIFLGYQIFFAPKAGVASDARTADEVFAKIVQLDKDHNKQLIDIEFRNFEQKLKQELENGKITREQKNEMDLHATILKSHTDAIVAIKTDRQGDLLNVFNALTEKQKALGGGELWKKEFAVAPEKDVLPQASFSGESLMRLAQEKLTVMNKTAKVIGYIPGYHMMEWLVNLTGAVPGFSYWFAGLLLAIIVRTLVFPLAQKQFIWGRRMSQLGPYIKEIKEKFTDKKTGQVTDQQGMTMETMELYKKYGMNPFSGCLPMLIQLPLFLIIYQCMLLYRFEFTKGYFLWIQPNAGSFLGIPLATSLGEQDYLLIFLYGVSMVATTMLTPVSDPANAKQQRLMGIGMSVMFAVMMFFWPLPSAFVAYWIFTNILTTAQSLYVYRMPTQPLVPVQSTQGGVIPTTTVQKNGQAKDVKPGFFDKLGKKK